MNPVERLKNKSNFSNDGHYITISYFDHNKQEYITRKEFRHWNILKNSINYDRIGLDIKDVVIYFNKLPFLCTIESNQFYDKSNSNDIFDLRPYIKFHVNECEEFLSFVRDICIFKYNILEEYKCSIVEFNKVYEVNDVHLFDSYGNDLNKKLKGTDLQVSWCIKWNSIESMNITKNKIIEICNKYTI
jgi:hypothetical protein